MQFGEYLYDRLPEIYRYRDIETEYTLERYLQCLGEFLDIAYKETGDIKNLLDVYKMPSEFLPIYAKMFGFKIYDDIPEQLQRRILANIIPVLKRKGTREVIEFVAREITGYDIDITEGNEYVFKTWQPEVDKPLGAKVPVTFEDTQTIHYRYAGSELTSRFIIFVEIHTTDISVTLSEEVLRRYLKDLVPSYLNIVFVLNQHFLDEADYTEVTYISVTEHGFKDMEVVGDRMYGSTGEEYFDIFKYVPNLHDVQLQVDTDLQTKVHETMRYTINTMIADDYSEDTVKAIVSEGEEIPIIKPKPEPLPIVEPDTPVFIVDDLKGALILSDSRGVSMQSTGKFFNDMTVDAKIGVSANYFYNASTSANRLVNYPADVKCIIVWLGVNDPGTSGVFFTKNLLTALRQKYVDKPIILIKELYCGSSASGYTSLNSQITTFNADMKEYIQAQQNMYQIDCSKDLYNSSGILSSTYTSDGIHLYASGYTVLWDNAVPQILNIINTGSVNPPGKDNTRTDDETIVPQPIITDPLYYPKGFKGKITNNYELMARAYDVAENYNTCYLYGGTGQIVTSSVVNAKASQYPSFYSSRRARYNDYINSSKTYWGFDCVNLYKALLWGWVGDDSKVNGGAKYGSNGVPDQNANGTFNLCKNKSSVGWDNMEVGEALWISGHFGVYVGGGKCIECTPRWTKINGDSLWNGVMVTAVTNCSNYPKNLNGRKWTQHGKMPWINYLKENPFIGYAPTPSSGGTVLTPSLDPNVTNIGRVTAEALTVRSGGSTSYSELGYLSNNDRVEIVGVESTGWYKIKYQGGYGYVSNNYIVIESTTGTGGVSTPTQPTISDNRLTFVKSDSKNAIATAYYPANNSLEGGTTDACGNKLLGFPRMRTVACPSVVPFGTKVKVLGTGTDCDGQIFTCTDRGGAIVVKADGTYHIDICFPDYNSCMTIGRKNCQIELGDEVNYLRKIAVCKKAIYIRDSKSSTATKIATTRQNYRLTVLDDSDPSWVKVEHLGREGYVDASNVTIILV